MAQDTQVLIIGDYYDVPRQRLIDQYPCAIYEDAADPAALLAEIAPTCRAIASHAPVTAALMDALPHLGVIANFGVGYDLVDVAAADARGIKVTNTPDVLNDEVADLAVGLMLATCRRMIKADAYVRAGRWAAEGNMAFTQRVWGKRLGLLGMGRIGREIADRCAAFKMAVSYHTRTPKDVPYTYVGDLATLAGDNDILISVVPGTPETAGIISADIMTALGPNGVLINVGRGSAVDEAALIACLADGRLGAAGLDVFADEPRVPAALIEMTENVVLQPHHASATHDTRDAMGQMMIDNIAAHFAGRPLISPVN